MNRLVLLSLLIAGGFYSMQSTAQAEIIADLNQRIARCGYEYRQIEDGPAPAWSQFWSECNARYKPAQQNGLRPKTPTHPPQEQTYSPPPSTETSTPIRPTTANDTSLFGAGASGMGNLSIYHWLLALGALVAMIFGLNKLSKKDAPFAGNPNSAARSSVPRHSQSSPPPAGGPWSAGPQSEPYTSYPAPPSPPRPARIDTLGAIEDMRLARSYMDDWYADEQSGVPQLSFAARYVEQAREKDPDAKLVVPSKKKDEEPIVYTQDDLAGELLYLEGTTEYHQARSHEFTEKYTKELLIKSADLFKRAIAFCPHSVGYRSKLADVYLDLYDKPSAMAVAEDALRQNPTSLDARKLVDRIAAAPQLEEPTYWQKKPGSITSIGVLAVVAGLVIVAITFTSKSSDAVSSLLFLLFIGGGLLWFFGRKKEKDLLLDKAMAEQERNRKRR